MSLGQFSTDVFRLLGSLSEFANLAGLQVLLGLVCIGVIIGIIFYLVGGR